MSNLDLTEARGFLVSLLGTVLLTTLCVSAAIAPARAAAFTPILF